MFGITTLFGGKREEREASSIADMLVQNALTAASTADAGTTSAAVFEACRGLWSRGFAAADSDRLTSAQLAVIGRALCEFGNSVWLVRDGALVAPIASWDIQGGFDPAGWRYRVNLAGPSGTEVRDLPADRVAHFRIHTAAVAPWRGRSPFSLNPTTARLVANLETQLANEAKPGPAGKVLPVPRPTDALKNDVNNLNGNVVLGPTMAGGHGGGVGDSRSGANDWRPQRFGADPPAATVELRGQAEVSIASAAGCPADLVTGRSTTEALRESMRQFVYTTILPMALELGPEIRAKVGGSGNLTFTRLNAADVQGRARAFKSLTDGGVAADRALALTGF